MRVAFAGNSTNRLGFRKRLGPGRRGGRNN